MKSGRPKSGRSISPESDSNEQQTRTYNLPDAAEGRVSRATMGCAGLELRARRRAAGAPQLRDIHHFSSLNFPKLARGRRHVYMRARALYVRAGACPGSVLPRHAREPARAINPSGDCTKGRAAAPRPRAGSGGPARAPINGICRSRARAPLAQRSILAAPAPQMRRRSGRARERGRARGASLPRVAGSMPAAQLFRGGCAALC